MFDVAFVRDVTSLLLIALGTIFIFVASIGQLRMPDIFSRMSASTKAATLGLALVLLGTAVHFASPSASGRAFLILLFILATAPVSAHLIGRAAYIKGNALWDKTRYDELAGKYDDEKKILKSK